MIVADHAEKGRMLAVLALAVIALTVVPVALCDSDAGTLCTVALEGNGGTATDGSSSQTYSVISGQSFEAPSDTFTKSGCILTGWSASSSGSVQWYPGQDIPITSNRTLYAVWQDLSYNGLVKVGGSSDSKTYESAVVQTAIGGPTSLPLSEDDTAYPYMQAVYTRYGIKYTLTVTHDGSPISSDTNSVNTSISASWLTLDISRSGTFSFSGSPNTAGIHVVEVSMKTRGMGDSYGDLDDLLIRWYVVVPVTVDSQPELAFSMDGGSGSVNSMKGPAGTAVVLPSYTDSSGKQISRSGYTLAGWEIPDGRGSSSVYALGSLYTLAFNATAKAKWVQDPNVLVYSLDGGSLENVEAYAIYDGSSLTLRDSGVTKSGYTLLGWRPTQDKQVSYAPGLTIEASGSMYMEAYFVPVGATLHTVTFDANGGQGTVYSQKVESGMYVKLPSSLCMVRDGYTFVGWSESKNGTVLSNEDYQVGSDVTLYAVWQQNPTPDPDEPDPTPAYYTVAFNTDQGQGTYSVQRIASGGLVTRPADPTRGGFVFLGWRSLTQTSLWDFSTGTVQSDTILQAQWAQHFTVSVDGLTVTVQMMGVYYDMAFDVYWGDQDFNDSGKETSDAIGASVGKASHTYGYTSYGYITVRSHDSKGYYESRMPYSVQGEHYNPRVDWIVTFDPGNGGSYSEQIVDAGKTATEPEEPTWDGHTFNGWYFEGKKWDFATVVTQDMKLVGGWDDVVPEDDDDTPTVIKPKASFTITETDGGWKLDASGSTNAVSYKWTLDGKGIGTGKTTVLKSEGLSEGEHAVKLFVTSSTGQTDYATKTIAVSGEGDDKGSSTNWMLIGAATVLFIIAIMVVRFWI